MIAIMFTPLGFFSLALNVVLALFFNKLYFSFAKGKINKIKAKNPGKSIDELKTICASKGGTSIGLVFLGFGVEILIAFGVILILILFGSALVLGGMFSEISDLINLNPPTDLGNDVMPEVDNIYNGALYYDISLDIDSEFSYQIPDVFEDNSFGDYELEYKYDANPDEVFGDCTVGLAAVQGYNSASDFIKQLSDYHSGTSVERITINNIDWYYTTYGSFGDIYSYATLKDGKVYLYQFEISSGVDEGVCEPYHQTIINSISSK